MTWNFPIIQALFGYTRLPVDFKILQNSIKFLESDIAIVVVN